MVVQRCETLTQLGDLQLSHLIFVRHHFRRLLICIGWRFGNPLLQLGKLRHQLLPTARGQSFFLHDLEGTAICTVLYQAHVLDLAVNELLLHKDPANDLDATIGSTIDVIFQNGVEQTLTVAGIYGDATFGNWLISLDTLSGISDAPARDFFVIAKLADGVDPTTGDVAVEAAMEPFPQANVQTNAEFLDSQEAQINQLLLIITLLLAFAILIAILGISITLALGVFERTREIGLLRAVGMNKRQTRRSVRWEAVIVSTFGALVGIVVGTFLGVVLTLAVPDDVISKLAFNPTIIVAILIGAVIAGLMAALYPSYKASNMNVLEAIATE